MKLRSKFIFFLNLSLYFCSEALLSKLSRQGLLPSPTESINLEHTVTFPNNSARGRETYLIKVTRL